MYTDIRIHELTLGHAERERTKQARLRELQREAREARGPFAATLIARLGTLLIDTGEALRRRSTPAGNAGRVERPAKLAQGRT